MSFFFTDTATTEIYTLSLHDALPIFEVAVEHDADGAPRPPSGERDERGPRVPLRLLPAEPAAHARRLDDDLVLRSEEHTSELQSRFDLVCRLLLEKKKQKKTNQHHTI